MRTISPLLAAALMLACGSSTPSSTEHEHSEQDAIDAAPTGVLRKFYIGAVKADWDYAPSGENLLTGVALEDDPAAAVFTVPGPDRIGRVYSKALYVEFTDNTFTTPRAAVDAAYRERWRHLGILGPVIHAAVGDRVEVVFKNLTPAEDGLAFSFHVHGLRYDKDSEGAPYEDGTGDGQKGDDRVLPGQTYTYRYLVDEGAGPGPMDPSSIVWMYHSHVDETMDTYTGLVGPIVVTRRGMARRDGSPVDVNRELFTLFEVVDENKSHYLQENIQRAGDPSSVNPDDEEFYESNLMHGINGYVYGNLPGLTMKVGERVRWNVLGMGTEIDLHTPHWHGETILWSGMRMDMLELLPNSMKVADMRPDNRGTWLFHCHVNDHLDAGMAGTFIIGR
jgi:FtsP/CotA-like multicopper oxidase with cupredoxin domain